MCIGCAIRQDVRRKSTESRIVFGRNRHLTSLRRLFYRCQYGSIGFVNGHPREVSEQFGACEDPSLTVNSAGSKELEEIMNYQINNILYATDLGPHGPEVFRHAMGFSQSFKAKVHVLHVMEPLSDYAEALLSTYISEEMRTKISNDGFEEARQEMEQRADKICKDSGLTRNELEAMVGEIQAIQGVPHQAILEAAKRLHADIIIMGSHGQTVVGEMLLGSVAHKVIMKSKIPVLLVPISSD